MSEALGHPHRTVLDHELQSLRSTVSEMGELVDQAITRAMWGLTERNVALCAAVIDEDAHINDLHREINDLAFTVILTQQPVARDLREILAVLRMATELERMGDHCVSIAKIGRTLADLPELTPHIDLAKMGRFCSEQVRDILNAVIARDVDRARAIAARDDRVDRIYHRLFDELIQVMGENSEAVFTATNLVFTAHHLERIADRVTNIAEDLVFLEVGLVEELG